MRISMAPQGDNLRDDFTQPSNSPDHGIKLEVAILTRRFALELGQHGITVNAVAPGFVRTTCSCS